MLRNGTPHAVVLVLPSGRRVVLPPATRPVRVLEGVGQEDILRVEGEAVPVLVIPAGPRAAVLPDATPGVALVVSAAVARAHPERPDLFAPATGPGEGALRDARGAVVAVTRLKRYAATPPIAGYAYPSRSAVTARSAAQAEAKPPP